MEFKKNKDYHLISKTDIIIPEKITTELDTDIIGKDVFYFRSISSTNIYAKRIAEKGVREGFVVIADIQTHGRGRKNRMWFSSFGGLWFSVVLKPNISLDRGMFVTMVASISVVQAIKKITNIDPVIKWPNDLLINGKKVCGILTEFDIKNDKINYAVVGLGINLNNKINKKIKKIATSISIEIDSNISRIKFLKIILKYFDDNYKKLIKGDFSTIKKLWCSYSNMVGTAVKINDNGDTISGIISGIDKNGYLILKTEKGIKKIYSGDLYYS
jgi:BirA family biotin operon repressor/biotin-[acetyl-CoA-carboxylase] ligase